MTLFKTLTIALLFFWRLEAQPQNDLYASRMRCEYRVDPVGIDVLKPRLSWEMVTGHHPAMQSAYQIRVAQSEKELESGSLWNSTKVASDQSTQVEYDDPDLESGKRYYWQVKIWDDQGRESDWSSPAFWEMGMLNEPDWTAKWISPDIDRDTSVSFPAAYLRHDFKIDKPISSARAYVTARGLYEAYVNGQKVGDQLFTPGWTSYEKRLQYQTYDITSLLSQGPNTFGAILGDGWYRGNLGWSGNRNSYGTELAFLVQVIIHFQDGSLMHVVSDDSWKSSTGPILWSDIYNGEAYDARLEMEGWSGPSFKAKNWEKTVEVDHPYSNLIGSNGPPVRKMEIVKPIEIFRTPKNELVVDMGQNMVGWVKIRAQGASGDKIVLNHAEVLDREGNFYIENLRSARQQVEYILKGKGPEVFEPHFTFQGFRYVRVEGYPGELDLEDMEGIVIYSQMEETGTFECSHPLINRLQQNIKWGQKGNFLDVPTDCPQRDERMGWTGDAQTFASTGSFNMDVAAFFTKWLKDLEADQLENGSVPFVIPNVLGPGAAGSTGWADAATIIPWSIYLNYGDKRILENQYPSMKAWVDFMASMAGENYLYQEGSHFGDWLFFIHPTSWNDKPGYTDIDLIATAFFAHSTEILAKTARILGYAREASFYWDLHSKIKMAFQYEFLTKSGRLSSHSQTAYTLALAFELIPPNLRGNAANYLEDNIKSRDYHLSTGFLGASHLCHVLTQNGLNDVAYKLLLQETYPSWLYPVRMGATTVWERWDGIKPDSSFQTAAMNSFNHYAYGAIGDWMYKVIAGINPDPKNPGYKHIIIKPQPEEGLSSAKATYHSMYGLISSEWKRGEELVVKVEIPANSRATIHLPDAKGKEVKLNGAVLGESSHDGSWMVVEVGSGVYEFRY